MTGVDIMMMCSVCNKNIAVVFVTKIINGKHIQEGMCISCAKKQGIRPVAQMIEQTGMSEEDIENLNNQVNDLLENMDLDSLDGRGAKALPSDGNFINGFLRKAFSSQSEGNQDNKKGGDEKGATRIKTQERKNTRKKKFLDMYGINLTDKAKTGGVDRVIGREKEIDRVIQILNRRTKNNPVLIGEPGVGKTAIAEGLSVRIADHQVPAKLYSKEVYVLDLTAVVAGTQFRGQFEARMKGIVEEVKTLGNIILVIDELHNIMGAGDAEGAMNAANILKPALSKGDIQVIGATTLKEYRKSIEKDSALERRFQPVIVNEPSIEESIEILKGIKDYYESYHRVRISDKTCEAAVRISERYITDRYLPDKAIDVIDEASSRANLRNELLVELEALKEELLWVQEEKESAISADSIEEYQKAADLKVRECKLIESIKDLESKNESMEITMDDIAYVVEIWTGIPVQRLTEIETKKLLDLENRLHKKIVGQHKAVSALSKTIRRNRAGFGAKKKPSSFIFVGPTGVGKTELVKVLAEELFGSLDNLIRVDMSEYMEKHSVSKLVGSPPGYVGYDDGGQLTEKVRRKPYSVILFDEIEKAHPDVFNILLQIFEDGRLTDSQGRVVSFENTVIVMTSNAGNSIKAKGIGFYNDEYQVMETKVNDVLREIFRPEFLNRIDDIVVFTELSKEELGQIFDLMLKDIEDDAGQKNMTVTVTQGAKDFLIEKGYDAKYGARPLRRTLEKYIRDEITEHYLMGRFSEGSEIMVDLENGALTFSDGVHG